MKPTYTETVFDQQTVRIKARYLGDVEFITALHGRQGDHKTLSRLIKLAIDANGDELYDFVKTMARLYGQDPDKIMARLNKAGRLSLLQQKLITLYKSKSPVCDDITRWVAWATGLSNGSLENPMNELTPLDFLDTHGANLHLGDATGIVCVRCPSCNQRFLIRVGLFQQGSQLNGAKAYSIPGLKYLFTLRGVAGLIVKDGRPMARFLWGVPTCDCEKLEDARFSLDDLPLPQPNTFQYGNQKKKGWLPALIRTRSHK